MYAEPPPFAELCCRSNYSFLTGASEPEELVERAAAKHYTALAITDECSVSGVVRGHLAARECGLHYIVGSEIQLTTAGGHPFARIVFLAADRRGYGNLCEAITLARRRAEKGSYSAQVGDYEGKSIKAPHLAGLPGCLALLVPQPDATVESLFAQAMWLKTWFPDRAWLVGTCEMEREDDLRWHVVDQVAETTGLRVVATSKPLMHSRGRKRLQDVLTAVRVSRPVQKCGFDLRPNSENYLRSRSVLAELFVSEWLHETVEVARRCTFNLEELRYEYPAELVPEGETAPSYLRKLSYEGAAGRFPAGLPEKVRKQIEHELTIIRELEYESYFLTVEDIVRWARDRGILCQGRGSAANSAVCFCLYVTEVDPARMNVLFERFISAERKEPPDIDIDFEHQRREEVMQYIYRKYGRERAALTGVVISYRTKSCIRDVGKALDFPLEVVDRLAKTAYGTEGHEGQWVSDACLIENGLDPSDARVRTWLELADALRDFPRHMSQHPGGFIISRDKLSRTVPIENASMDDRTIVQWDKNDIDALGLLKIDVLALGILTAIHRTLDLVAVKRGAPYGMQDVSAEDAATYEMLCKADSVGVFQVESRAQMSMLPRMQPRVFYDLVIQIALVRPGPIQGGMVHPYLRRRAGEEAVSYPSPEVRAATERTLGIPVFQEQVTQLAMSIADFTAGEADQLRRAMGAWRKRGGLDIHQQRLIERTIAKGYSPEFADQLAKQVEGFSSYGFPESHSASFALLVYVSAYLKRHHPDAFLIGLLNSQPMGFYAPAQLVRDAREHGVVVRPPDVTLCDWDSTMEEEACEFDAGGAPRWDTTYDHPLRAVRLGMSRISGMRELAARRIVVARQEAPFASVEDMAMRAELDAHDLKCLSGADALLTLSGRRPDAVWAAIGVDTRPTQMLRQARTIEDPVLFAEPKEGGEIVDDYAAIGLSLRRHPLALLRERLASHRVRTAEDLRTKARNGDTVRASGIVTHRQQPGTAKGVVFATLEDETGTINIIVWPKVAEEQRAALRGSRLLSVQGTWQHEKGVQHLIATKLWNHTALLGELRVSSRDFK